ncbi:hypothetical protein BT96DRAFT_975707 [Gymnopus androsaceus JB14]|uniref:DUF6534 domain-containing protein n=1 Tax=Gymnopus androsaceus JB14 TaxID=1447944 RepID=A0A6A4HRS4_9AGAR|nr:hypothetical protein BT96DRAFT_975707 [Gymnopus androsaceus JB14]
MASTIPTGVVLPSFNNTLGAFFIGSSFATMLYGVTCVQTFLYLTSRRSQFDTWAMKCFVLVLFVSSALDTAQQCVYTAGLYKFLITDFANPLALNTVGPNSGLKLIAMDEGLIGFCVIFFIQLFFCFRLWVISTTAYSKPIRIALVTLALALSVLNCGAWGAIAILGYQMGGVDNSGSPDPRFDVAWKMSTASGIAFDTIITIALTSSLYRARSGIKKSNHVINLIIIATVNTNLITTLLSLAQLITFLALPFAEYYGGIAFVLPKSYMNCFLAMLNYRDYLQKKLDNNNTTNLVSLETMRARPGNGSQPDSSPNTTNFRDVIEVHVETKPADIMAV